MANMTARIYNIVELLGFHKILEICESVDGAMEKFRQ